MGVLDGKEARAAVDAEVGGLRFKGQPGYPAVFIRFRWRTLAAPRPPGPSRCR